MKCLKLNIVLYLHLGFKECFRSDNLSRQVFGKMGSTVTHLRMDEYCNHLVLENVEVVGFSRANLLKELYCVLPCKNIHTKEALW